MTEEELRELIAQGESFTVEFKGEERQALSDQHILEEVICLANGEGGHLLVGIEDDGRITGARPRHGGTTDPQRVQAFITNNTRPVLGVRAEVVPLSGRPVLVISVAQSRQPVGTAEGKYKRRAILGRGEPGCLPFHFHEMQSRLADQGGLDYSALPLPEVTWDDLDPLEFERMRRFIREGHGKGDSSLASLPDVEIAKALGLVEANHEVRAVRAGGLLLFGKEEAIRRHLPTHEFAFQRLEGTKVLANDFFRWPLLRVVEEVRTRFRALNREEEVMVGMVRLGIPDYSEVGFREALANALIHRDYSRMGAIHLQWQTDQVQISKPGGFLPGIRLDNLLVVPPRPRNPLLADAFKRAGLVERTGRGIDLIYEGQLRYGRPVPEYGLSTETDVVVDLRGGPANLTLARFIAERGYQGRSLSLEDLLVLNEAERERRIDAKRTAALLQRPETTARAQLNRMVEGGLVEGRGEGKRRSYYLSPAVYRALGSPAEYVRARGFELIQQEQMILQYVQAHGRITRREVEELCQISEDQAYRLLRKLVDGKALRLTGDSPKAAWYERAD